ncbi:hypothetical protein TNCV_1846461 [Trichonephila clavipes]|nr:hypothetical protein TNCV_1846461 [Trichonephila clavipes]
MCRTLYKTLHEGQRGAYSPNNKPRMGPIRRRVNLTLDPSHRHHTACSYDRFYRAQCPEFVAGIFLPSRGFDS